jgi:hypothetical protein
MGLGTLNLRGTADGVTRHLSHPNVVVDFCGDEQRAADRPRTRRTLSRPVGSVAG